ncbi:MAG: hypothetical protein J6S58_07525 [Lentisphaeria bacterium]|nr:hypothetical protein [Lentisphaeria bacterium]
MTPGCKTLLIFNGDYACECWKKSCPSEVEKVTFLVWRENYLEGPLPSGVSPEVFEKTRADFLHTCVPEYSAEGIYRYLMNLHTTLKEFEGPECEIILYFDCCMYDMIMLARILSLLKNAGGRIRLFCEDVILGNAPEVFQQDISSLRVLSPEQIALYAHAWECVLGGSAAVAQFNQQNLAAEEPFLAQASVRYGEDHPADGTMGRSQRQLLEIVRSGVCAFPEIFRAFDKYEQYMFMGDTFCLRLLEELVRMGLLCMKKSSDTDPYPAFYPAERGK